MIVINVENNVKSFLNIGYESVQKHIDNLSKKIKIHLNEVNRDLSSLLSFYKDNISVGGNLFKDDLREKVIPGYKKDIKELKEDLSELLKLYKDILSVGLDITKEDFVEEYNESIKPKVLFTLEKCNQILDDLEDVKYSEVFKISAENNVKFLKVGLSCLALSFTSISINSYKVNEVVVPAVQVSFGLDNLENSTLVKTNKSISHGITRVVSNVTESVFHSKKDAFISLLGVTEGHSPIFYKDNLGVATAYGWNPTKNSKEFNVEIAKDIGMTPAQVKSIEKISANKNVQSVPASLKNVVLTDSQVKKSAEVMMVYYEQEFLNVMKKKCIQQNKDCEVYEKKWHNLPANQQAVMIHMAYKVGTPNLLKYNQFFSGLFKYMDNPTEKNLQIIKDNLEYSFKTRKGEVKHDKPVEFLHKFVYEECGYKANMNVLNKNAVIENCKNYLAENYKEIDPKTKKLKVGAKG